VNKPLLEEIPEARSEAEESNAAINTAAERRCGTYIYLVHCTLQTF